MPDGPAGRSWLLMTAAAGFGLVAGLGLFTFDRADGLSYFSDNPEACVNCHVMRDQFEGWNHSSHRQWATCNDCHTPYSSFFAAYYSKAVNGWNHSVAFTLGGFPEPIVITPRNEDIVLASCVGCHAAVTSEILGGGDLSKGEFACLHCHSDVGH